MMNEKKQSAVKRILGTRGMGAVITAFAGLIIIYVAFGLIDRKVFAGQNVMNLLRSMSKYLLIGVGQSYLLITGTAGAVQDKRIERMVVSLRKTW